MSIRYSLLKFRVKVKNKFRFNPKFSPDENKAIELVKGLAKNPDTTILFIPGEKMVAYNDKVCISIEFTKMNIGDGDEYFDLELSPKGSETIYKILLNIVNSRVRQAEKKIIQKKEMMLEKMVNDANLKNEQN